MESSSKAHTWKVLLSFAIIYFVWGSTFLAIRVGVREVPPFLLAGMRFLVAGVVLYAWMRLKGTPTPAFLEWGSASLLAVLIFVFDYGLLFWAEKRVPSGIAAVMMATIPVFMALSEILILRTQRLTMRLALALLVGERVERDEVDHLAGRPAGGEPVEIARIDERLPLGHFEHHAENTVAAHRLEVDRSRVVVRQVDEQHAAGQVHAAEPTPAA